MKVLVACEFSGVVRRAFAAVGHNVTSCDLLAADDGSNRHYQGNVLDILDNGWDLMIGHPPCTYLANSGAKHLYKGMKKENGLNLDRLERMQDGSLFFRSLWERPIPRIALENPIMHRHAKAIIGVDQTQIIQPWQFGHKEMKATCLWLKNLKPLRPTDIVGPPPKDTEERKKWAKVHRAPPGPDRWKIRSRTYEGIAQAMAEQWGNPELSDKATGEE